MDLFHVLHAPRRVTLLIAALDMSPFIQQLVKCEHEVRDSLLMVPALGLKPRVAGRYGQTFEPTSRVWMKRSGRESSRFCGVNTS